MTEHDRPLAPGVEQPRRLERAPASPAPRVSRASVVGLQSLVGNQAVGRLLNGLEPDRINIAGGLAVPLEPLSTLQRQDSGPAPADTGAGGGGTGAGGGGAGGAGGGAGGTVAVSTALGTYNASTYAQLELAERLLTAQLETEAQQLTDGDPVRTKAESLIVEARSLEPFLQSKADAPLDQTAVDQAHLWYDELTEATTSIRNTVAAAVREAAERNNTELQDAADQLQQVQDKSADTQRLARIAKKDELLEQIQQYIGGALTAATALLDAKEKSEFMLTKLTGELPPGETTLGEAIEHYAPYVEAAHLASAGLEAMQASAKLMWPEGATEIDQQCTKANAALDLVPAATSILPQLVDFIPGLGLYTAYATILVKFAQAAITFALSLQREKAHDFNQMAISMGDLNSVDWSAEPGGREAFDFMVKVMHTDNWTEIQQPIPEAVNELFTSGEEQFSKGTGEEVPTKGFWFWKGTNPKKIRQWLFNNRQNVWNMLYGATSVPAGP